MRVLKRSPHHTPSRLTKMKRSDNTMCSQRRGVLLNPFTLRSERTAQQKHLASLCEAAHVCSSQPALLLLETETQTQTSLSTETLLRMAGDNMEAILSVVWGSTPQSDTISSVKCMRPHTKWNRSY